MDFARPNLTLVVDRRLYRLREDGREPLSLVEAAIAGGITMLQLRLSVSSEPGDDLAVEAIAQRLREMSSGRVPFIVTSDLQLAERSRADGVMLVGDRTYKPDDAKNYLHVIGGTIVGYYADSVATASRAERGGADFVQAGPAFDGEPPEDDGLALIRKIKDAINIPLVAFGGIDTPERVKAAIQAGADGVAVTQGILDAPNPQEAAEALLAAMVL